MAQQITFNIPDDIEAAKILDNIVYNNGYSDDIENPDFDPEIDEDPVTNPATIPNPVTKKQWLKLLTIAYWREMAKVGKRQLAAGDLDAEFDPIIIT